MKNHLLLYLFGPRCSFIFNLIDSTGYENRLAKPHRTIHLKRSSAMVSDKTLAGSSFAKREKLTSYSNWVQ